MEFFAMESKFVMEMEIVLALGILVREDLYVMELAMNQQRIVLVHMEQIVTMEIGVMEQIFVMQVEIAFTMEIHVHLEVNVAITAMKLQRIVIHHSIHPVVLITQKMAVSAMVYFYVIPKVSQYFSLKGAGDCVAYSEDSAGNDTGGWIVILSFVGIALGALILGVAIIVVVISCRRKRHNRFMELRNTEWNELEEVIVEEKLGSGNFGEVYRGTWRGTTLVALKKLKTEDEFKDFINEATILQ
jgi:hypothetical protein